MSRHISNRGDAILWGLQGALALVFLFAGGSKEIMSVQALAQASGLNGSFMRFIGLAEIAGGLGLVLPGASGIKRQLTPLAAAGLVVIMIGAVVTTALKMGIVAALAPAVVGVLLIIVIRARRESPARRFRRVSFDVASKAV